MRTLIYLLIAICLMSCDKEKKDEFPGPRFIDIVLINGEGYNLLNSEVDDAIEFENVRNLYLINGEYVNQYHGSYDWPKNCGIYDSEHSLGNVFRLFLSEYTNGGNTTATMIDWGNGDSDTIIATINPVTNLPYSEFWYNGVSMNDLSEKSFGEGNYYFEIEKNYSTAK